MAEIMDVAWFALIIASALAGVAGLVVLGAWLAKQFALWALDVQERRVQVDRQRMDSQLVMLTPNMAQVSRGLVESGELAMEQIRVLLADIHSRTPQVLPANVPHTLTYSPHMIDKRQPLALPEPEEIVTPEIVMPDRDIWQLYSAGALPAHGFLLGHNLETGEPVTADWLQLYSALVGGTSGSGKSTMIRGVLIQSALQGGRFVVIDRHYGAGDESLGASLQPLRSLMMTDIAANEKQMLDALRLVLDIGRQRKSGQDADKSPIILVVDETTAMLQRSNIASELGTVLGEISQETRKVGIYALCIGQNFSAKIMPTEIRNSFASFISCRTRADVARVMSGNSEFGQMAAGLRVGQAVWMDTNGDVVRLAVPNATQAHIDLVARQVSGVRRESAPVFALPQVVGSPSPAPSGSPSPSPSDGSNLAWVVGAGEGEPIKADEARILLLWEGGANIGKIVEELYGVKGGDKFIKKSNEIQAVLRKNLRRGTQ